MAFSKAKRFIYKKPEPTPSPADYVVTAPLEKGFSIPKSPRFPEPAKEDEHPVICSRALSRSNGRCSMSKEDKEHQIKEVKRRIVGFYRNDISCGCSFVSNEEKEDQTKELKRRTVEFNRNDIGRQSIRRKSLKFNEQCTSNSEQRKGAISSESLLLSDDAEFIDDDYDSFISFDELDQLRDIEKHELQDRRRSLARNKQKQFEDGEVTNFELGVLSKLKKIASNMDDVKEDFDRLRKYQYKRRNGTGKKHLQRQLNLTTHEKCEHINEIIKRVMGNLARQVELSGKSMNRQMREKIIQFVVDIYLTSEKSMDEINTLVNNTEEVLSKHIANILNRTTASAPTSVRERVSNKENCLTNENSVYYKNVCSGVSYQVQRSQEDEEFSDDDDLDITIKLEGTQKKLEFQGAIIKSFRDVLTDLKENLV